MLLDSIIVILFHRCVVLIFFHGNLILVRFFLLFAGSLDAMGYGFSHPLHSIDTVLDWLCRHRTWWGTED